MSTLRASSLPLLTKCTGSLHLTCSADESEEARIGAAWGDMAHHWKETGEVRGPDKRTETAFRKALNLSGAETWRGELWPAGGAHEYRVAVRVDGTREVERDPEGKREGQPGWVTGKYDFAYRDAFGQLVIRDLKTGKFYPNPPGGQGYRPDLEIGANRYPQDPKSAQVRLYALAESVLQGYDGVVHTVIDHWPRLPLEHRHRPPKSLWHTWTQVGLLAFWGELERLYRDRELRPGDHCRFCPARASCLVAPEFN